MANPLEGNEIAPEFELDLDFDDFETIEDEDTPPQTPPDGNDDKDGDEGIL